MLRKFLFYFIPLLCCATFLLSCHRRFSSTFSSRPLGSITWAVGNSTQESSTTHHALVTAARAESPDSSANEGRPEWKWIGGKTVEWQLAKAENGAAARVVEMFRAAFFTRDTLLLDSLNELVVNGREFAENRVPWSAVGIRAEGKDRVRIQCRRRSPSLVTLILSHPELEPVLPRPTPSFLHLRRASDPLTRARLVLNSEADFTEDLPAAIIPTVRQSDRFREIATHWRLFIMLNPRRPGLTTASSRKGLLSRLEPTEMIPYLFPGVLPTRTILRRVPDTRAPASGGGWFKRSALPVATALHLQGLLPLAHPQGKVLLAEGLANLTAQLGKSGMAAVTDPGDSRLTPEALDRTDLWLVLLPAPPFASQHWSEIFTVQAQALQNKSFDNLLVQWNLSRDDESLEESIDEALMAQEEVWRPVGTLRQAALIAPRVQEISLTPFGYWDWSAVRLAGE